MVYVQEALKCGIKLVFVTVLLKSESQEPISPSSKLIQEFLSSKYVSWVDALSKTTCMILTFSYINPSYCLILSSMDN